MVQSRIRLKLKFIFQGGEEKDRRFWIVMK